MKRDWLDVLMMVLMFISGFTILVYGLLKAFGVINTPVWILGVPYVAGGITILSIVYYFGKLANKIEHIGKGIKSYERMKQDFIIIRNNQELCLTGKLGGSPYSK